MAGNIANKDAAMTCLSMAKSALVQGDKEKALKFAEKAARLYSCVEVAAFLDILHTAPSEQPSSSGNRSADPQLPTRQRRTAAPDASESSAAAAENKATPEQRELVDKILRSKDFYDILGVPKDAGDDDIKRAYRKLALKLHPDKNSAPRAEDAFKAVSKAFSCLSDGDKRAYYDRTGFENAGAAQAATTGQRPQGPAGMYYADEFDPEEIFRMFFGGGIHPNVHVFRHHQFGAQRRAQANPASPQEQQRNLMMMLLQLLPVFLIFVWPLMSQRSEPLYSLTQQGKYNDQMMTAKLDVPYFVPSATEFERRYPDGSGSRFKLERQVENDYYERVHAECQQEKLYRQRMYTWGDRNKARNLKMPSCDSLREITLKYETAY